MDTSKDCMINPVKGRNPRRPNMGELDHRKESQGTSHESTISEGVGEKSDPTITTTTTPSLSSSQPEDLKTTTTTTTTTTATTTQPSPSSDPPGGSAEGAPCNVTSSTDNFTILFSDPKNISRFFSAHRRLRVGGYDPEEFPAVCASIDVDWEAVPRTQTPKTRLFAEERIVFACALVSVHNCLDASRSSSVWREALKENTVYKLVESIVINSFFRPKEMRFSKSACVFVTEGMLRMNPEYERMVKKWEKNTLWRSQEKRDAERGLEETQNTLQIPSGGAAAPGLTGPQGDAAVPESQNPISIGVSQNVKKGRVMKDAERSFLFDLCSMPRSASFPKVSVGTQSVLSIFLESISNELAELLCAENVRGDKGTQAIHLDALDSIYNIFELNGQRLMEQAIELLCAVYLLFPPITEFDESQADMLKRYECEKKLDESHNNNNNNNDRADADLESSVLSRRDRRLTPDFIAIKRHKQSYTERIMREEYYEDMRERDECRNAPSGTPSPSSSTPGPLNAGESGGGGDDDDKDDGTRVFKWELKSFDLTSDGDEPLVRRLRRHPALDDNEKRYAHRFVIWKTTLDSSRKGEKMPAPIDTSTGGEEMSTEFDMVFIKVTSEYIGEPVTRVIYRGLLCAAARLRCRGLMEALWREFALTLCPPVMNAPHEYMSFYFDAFFGKRRDRLGKEQCASKEKLKEENDKYEVIDHIECEVGPYSWEQSVFLRTDRCAHYYDTPTGNHERRNVFLIQRSENTKLRALGKAMLCSGVENFQFAYCIIKEYIAAYEKSWKARVTCALSFLEHEAEMSCSFSNSETSSPALDEGAGGGGEGEGAINNNNNNNKNILPFLERLLKYIEFKYGTRVHNNNSNNGDNNGNDKLRMKNNLSSGGEGEGEWEDIEDLDTPQPKKKDKEEGEREQNREEYGTGKECNNNNNNAHTKTISSRHTTREENNDCPALAGSSSPKPPEVERKAANPLEAAKCIREYLDCFRKMVYHFNRVNPQPLNAWRLDEAALAGRTEFDARSALGKRRKKSDTSNNKIINARWKQREHNEEKWPPMDMRDVHSPPERQFPSPTMEGDTFLHCGGLSNECVVGVLQLREMLREVYDLAIHCVESEKRPPKGSAQPLVDPRSYVTYISLLPAATAWLRRQARPPGALPLFQFRGEGKHPEVATQLALAKGWCVAASYIQMLAAPYNPAADGLPGAADIVDAEEPTGVGEEEVISDLDKDVVFKTITQK